MLRVDEFDPVHSRNSCEDFLAYWVAAAVARNNYAVCVFCSCGKDGKDADYLIYDIDNSERYVGRAGGIKHFSEVGGGAFFA